MLARLGAWTGRLIAGLAFGLLVVGMAVGPIPVLAQTRSATLMPSNPRLNSITAVTSPFLISTTELDIGPTIGGSAKVSGAGCYLWNTRGQACTPADGVLQYANAAGTGVTRLILGTNDGTANGWSLLRSGTYIETWTGDGTSARTGIKTSGILNVGPFQSVNNIATAGSYGVPAILAAGSGAAISAAADTNRCTYTPAADGDFEISDNILVTTAGSIAATATIGYTDEGNTARTQTIPFVLVAGTAIVTAIASANGTVPYNGIPVHIRAKSGVAINVSTTGTFTGSVYNHRCIIRALQ